MRVDKKARGDLLRSGLLALLELRERRAGGGEKEQRQGCDA